MKALQLVSLLVLLGTTAVHAATTLKTPQGLSSDDEEQGNAQQWYHQQSSQQEDGQQQFPVNNEAETKAEKSRLFDYQSQKPAQLTIEGLLAAQDEYDPTARQLCGLGSVWDLEALAAKDPNHVYEIPLSQSQIANLELEKRIASETSFLNQLIKVFGPTKIQQAAYDLQNATNNQGFLQTGSDGFLYDVERLTQTAHGAVQKMREQEATTEKALALVGRRDVELDAAFEENRATTGQLDAARGQLAQTKSSLLEATQRNEDLSLQIEQLQGELERKNAAILDLSRRMKDALSSVDQARATLATQQGVADQVFVESSDRLRSALAELRQLVPGDVGIE